MRITGNDKTSSRLIRTVSGLHAGEVLSPLRLHNAISSIYATNLFDNVNIDMDTLHNARIMLIEKKYWRIRAGVAARSKVHLW